MSILPDVKYGSTWVDWEGDPVTVVFVSPTEIHYIYKHLSLSMRGATVRQFLNNFTQEEEN